MMISPKVDVWSVGVIFYMLLFGKKPFQAENGNIKNFKDKMIDRKFMLNFPSELQISENSKNLIQSMLRFDPEDRPEPAEALRLFHQNLSIQN